MPPVKIKPALGRNSSVLLDIIRFSAAVAVLFSHLPTFSVRLQHVPEYIGNQAVGVFFVLSGFVIRFVSETRLSTLGAYFTDRASRIYSIVLPALLFTIVAEALAQFLRPAGYGHFAHPDAWTHVLPRLLTNVTFTDGFWGIGPPLLSNGALWSLPFEVVYYILYGLLRYTRTARWFLVPLILLIAGPSIAGLFPVWLFGALLFDLYATLRHRASAVKISAAACLGVLVAFASFRHNIARCLAATDSIARVAFGVRHTNPALAHAIYPDGEVNWLARLSPSFFFLAFLLAAVLLPLMLSLDRALPAIPLAIERGIRLIADSTFTLYCFHLPLLILVFSIVGHQATTWAGSIAAIAGVIVFSIALARPLDRLKNRMRNVLRSRFLARA